MVFHPTLSLLSTPWEYFVTIDQSALWQKHIAWAKPQGSDLKKYISSQYSSRMVLLSLLLATEMSVFFGSSPRLVQLRQTLNIWETNNTRCLPFWIGFFLLLNICVTISGILATFSSWNVVSAISDKNAHCLLRSSLGQYITTLSPRLVVTSLYLFLLWFLLFVVEVLLGDDGGRWSIHALFTKHLHLLLLWTFFLVGIVALFFSIVVPLSAFGRLVLHTGAMAEHPVLSEGLQVELLPRGLHVGLVIKAHHSQKRGMAVTKQYHRQQQGKRRREIFTTNDELQYQQRQEENVIYPSSSRVLDTNHNINRLFSTDTTKDMDGLSHEHIYKIPPIGSQATPSMGLPTFVHDSTPQAMSLMNQNASNDNGDGQDNISKRKHPTNLLRHRRMPTTDTLASVKLPPASILNLSMTATEFHDVIDSAIDTSSLHSGGDNGGDQRSENRSSLPNHFLESEDDVPRQFDGDYFDKGIKDNTETFGVVSSSNYVSGMPLIPSIDPTTSNRNSRRQNSHQDLVTRHHRRVSSSRFLLEEWAQENRVRDLYGAAPPADLPHEIACLLFDNQSQNEQQETNSHSQSQLRSSRNNSATDNEVTSDINDDQTAKFYPHQWWASPFSSPFGTFHKNVNTDKSNNLEKPLLPDLTSFRDEELGGESSELLGECLLLPEDQGGKKKRASSP